MDSKEKSKDLTSVDTDSKEKSKGLTSVDMDSKEKSKSLTSVDTDSKEKSKDLTSVDMDSKKKRVKDPSLHNSCVTDVRGHSRRARFSHGPSDREKGRGVGQRNFSEMTCYLDTHSKVLRIYQIVNENDK
nr:hypothetical protein BgiMline_017190 [Biomphalaria glabrata]